jgi:predicted nucleotide-binding protein (sugar kinase/HSP70/actin superfamily)
MIKELKRIYPGSNIATIDYDPGASEVNQLNRLKLMLSAAFKSMNSETAAESQKKKLVPKAVLVGDGDK